MPLVYRDSTLQTVKWGMKEDPGPHQRVGWCAQWGTQCASVVLPSAANSGPLQRTTVHIETVLIHWPVGCVMAQTFNQCQTRLRIIIAAFRSRNLANWEILLSVQCASNSWPLAWQPSEHTTTPTKSAWCLVGATRLYCLLLNLFSSVIDQKNYGKLPYRGMGD